MRVMVTGATGFTGSHTARSLTEAGHEVRALVRDRAKIALIFGEGSSLVAHAVEGDILDEDAVGRALEGVDAVVHSAALVDLRRSMADKVLRTNVGGVENVIGKAVERGVGSIVYVSSLAAFFDPEDPPTRPLDLDSPLAPATSAYGRSKVESERYVRELQARGAPIRTSYPVGILGPDDPGLSEGNHAIVAWLGDQPTNTSSGLQILDVRDLAEIHLRMLEADGGPARYIAAGEFIAWSDMGPLLAELTGKPVPMLRIPGPLLRGLGRVGDVVKKFWDFDFPLTYEAMCFATLWPGADASVTRKELGIEFRDTRGTLRDTIAWLCAEGHLAPEKAGVLAERAATRASSTA
jgi:dihydroflavonol-4-reductase